MHHFHIILAVMDRQVDMLLSQRPVPRNMRRAGKKLVNRTVSFEYDLVPLNGRTVGSSTAST